MKEDLAFTAQGGRLRVIKVTGGANFSESTAQHLEICSAGKRWLLLSTCLYADTSATWTITVNGIIFLNSVAAGTGNVCNDNVGDDRMFLPNWLKAGEYVQYIFGAAQSTAAWVETRLIEVDV